MFEVLHFILIKFSFVEHVNIPAVFALAIFNYHISDLLGLGLVFFPLIFQQHTQGLVVALVQEAWRFFGFVIEDDCGLIDISASFFECAVSLLLLKTLY